MKNTYYKVLTYNRESCSVGGKFNVQYHVGEFVRPKVQGTPLFVFSSYTQASDFVAGVYGPRPYKAGSLIYECEVIRPRKAVTLSRCLVGGILEEYWNNRFKHKRPSDTKSAPVGSYLCDAVKITKKIL